jgi:hypothetical protein
MTAVHEIPTHRRSRATPPALTLTDEHSLLLRLAAIRAEGVLAVIAESRWPPDRWPFVLPAGWAWVRSADSPLATDGLSRAPGVTPGGDEVP